MIYIKKLKISIIIAFSFWLIICRMRGTQQSAFYSSDKKKSLRREKGVQFFIIYDRLFSLEKRCRTVYVISVAHPDPTFHFEMWSGYDCSSGRAWESDFFLLIFMQILIRLHLGTDGVPT
jgi:hypothetical protein